MEKFASMVHFVTTESLEVFNLRMQVSAVYVAEVWQGEEG
jgi:hypothetical protein